MKAVQQFAGLRCFLHGPHEVHQDDLVHVALHEHFHHLKGHAAFQIGRAAHHHREALFQAVRGHAQSAEVALWQRAHLLNEGLAAVLPSDCTDKLAHISRHLFEGVVCFPQTAIELNRRAVHVRRQVLDRVVHLHHVGVFHHTEMRRVELVVHDGLLAHHVKLLQYFDELGHVEDGAAHIPGQLAVGLFLQLVKQFPFVLEAVVLDVLGKSGGALFGCVAKHQRAEMPQLVFHLQRSDLDTHCGVCGFVQHQRQGQSVRIQCLAGGETDEIVRLMGAHPIHLPLVHVLQHACFYRLPLPLGPDRKPSLRPRKQLQCVPSP
mmetsp:Transcript_130/g.237  ORF Transcript_130/g.237 Transcript_130/m.237 type:complete len:320 (-) Transcript_130:1643-2602(-)